MVFLHVLHVHALRSIIFAYQDGIYEDLRPRFLEFHHKVRYSLAHYAGRGHDCFVGGRLVASPFHKTLLGTVTDRNLCLDEETMYDARFPLHLAIYEGQLHVATRILACRPSLVSADAIDCAFACGKLRIARYLLDQRSRMTNLCRQTPKRSFKSRSLPKYVVYFGRVELLQLLTTYIDDHGWDETAMQAAIRRRHIACAEYLWDTFPTTVVYEDLYHDVAIAGLFSLVVRCEKAHLPVSAHVLAGAASSGHLNIVRFLHERWRHGNAASAVRAAYAEGHRHIVRYLLTHRTEFAGQRGVDAAAKYGLLDIVQSRLAAGHCGSSDVAFQALCHGHLSVVRYLLYVGYSLDLSTVSPLLVWCWAEYKVARASTVEMLAFLHSRSFRFSAVWVDFAAAEGCLEAIRFLLDVVHAPCSPRAIDSAVFHPHVLSYLLSHTCARCTTKGFLNALHWETPLSVFATLLQHFRAECTLEVLSCARLENRLDVLELLDRDRVFTSAH
ncbi:hypothetical protein SPRG_06083 [Saprolegnia parasitica CBS 223.65]|uniref:Ankyrin repeat protein n=1 Tax=Saprolegnia parasitica (strain CBS 223.65) TaxID=695850 RepID=A0A067CEU2_SAPPC|nr:hypothetical protein SPRG_06083 [Saprolegnia parasitica CBS 223.65]KDO29028.1 hypothetical protein SPRG_06083 [Saprolegnia parasitica CBS 223.65]|eukprot:XP_012200198.1 hypothetical protein SPRG_06083 [Saprolegnia parasitica CBS 223.65]